MYAVPHSILMALYEDRLCEVGWSAPGRKARHAGLVQRLRKVLALRGGRAAHAPFMHYPVRASYTMVMATTTTGEWANAARQN
jgi:hypothetical protein